MSQWNRRFRRVPFAFRVVAGYRGTTLVGHCQRIATMGLYLYHHAPFPAEAEVELEFTLPVVKGEPLRLGGRVRRADAMDVGQGLLGGMQILFTDVGAREQGQLEQFVVSCIRREAEYLEMGRTLDLPGDLPRHGVRFFGTGTSRTEYVEDISEGGVLIRTLRPLPKGARTELDLYLPGGQRTTVGGQVAWSRAHLPEEPSKAGMGIQFEQLEPWAQGVVRNFVDTFGEDVQVPPD